MEKQKYAKAKELEERIFQLTLLKRYLEVFLERKPFNCELSTTVLNRSIKEVLSTSVNDSYTTNRVALHYQEDKEIVLDAINNRIKELECQFEKL
jgi:hypothetical protein